MAEVVVVAAAEIAAVGARWLAEKARAAVEARGRADIALSGGNTPKPILETLARYNGNFPWAKVHFWWCDERCVPPDDKDSNYAMAKSAILDRVAAVAHRMQGERGEAAAASYAAELPDVLDAMLLGMGEDLHTCSLFPGKRDWSKPVGTKVIYVADSPKPPAERITVTPDVIAVARSLLMVVTGAGKADQIAKALEGPERPDLYPAHLARRGTWLLDTAAAAKLQETSNG